MLHSALNNVWSGRLQEVRERCSSYLRDSAPAAVLHIKWLDQIEEKDFALQKIRYPCN